jgi:hypothetical protein
VSSSFKNQLSFKSIGCFFRNLIPFKTASGIKKMAICHANRFTYEIARKIKLKFHLQRPMKNTAGLFLIYPISRSA